MTPLFWGAGAVAVIAAVQVITRRQPMHALVYLVLMLLAVALMLFTIGASFVAALQVIIYAGAIIVLFVFAVMLLDLDARTEERERESMQGDVWLAPVILAAALFLITVYALARPGPALFGQTVPPKAVGLALFSRYMLGVEMASLLLLAGLVSAFHFGAFSLGALPCPNATPRRDHRNPLASEREPVEAPPHRALPARGKPRRATAERQRGMAPGKVRGMATVTVTSVLLLAGVLFAVGLLGVLVRRDLLFVLMSLEIMLNATVLAFAAAGARWHQPDGQVFILFILVTAAAEVSVGLPLVLQIQRQLKTVDTDEVRSMRG